MRAALICLGLVAGAGAELSHAQSPVSASAAPEAWVGFRSDPPGAEVRVADRVWQTPSDGRFASGLYTVEATLDGFLPLQGEVELAPADTIDIEFVMLREMPERPSAEDLGLEFRPSMPLRTIVEADKIKGAFTSMIETFAVTPLTLGVSLKVVDQDDGDGMIVSGVALIATSYLLGNFLHDRKAREIEAHNEKAAVVNSAARSHNASVESAIGARHAENMALWQDEAVQRGRVSITRR